MYEDKITPDWYVAGTKTETLELHITLPDGAGDYANHFLAQNDYVMTMELEKFDPKNHTRTTYHIRGGSMAQLLKELETLGYRPPRNWKYHVSL